MKNEIDMKHTVEVMISEQEVQHRVNELGREITAHYQGRKSSTYWFATRLICVYGRFGEKD